MAFRFRRFTVYQDAKVLHREIVLLSIALGSVDETIASLEVVLDLKIISQEQFAYFESKYQLISQQLGGFSKYLKRQSK